MNVAAEQQVYRARLNLPERGKGEVMQPRPTTGDHNRIVRSAAAEAIVIHHKTLSELAKI